MFVTASQSARPELVEGLAISDPVQQPAHPEPVEGQSLADIVREETDNGRLIVRFLVNLMQGDLASARPCHRLDAARQLFNLGFAPAQSFIAANPRSTPRSATARPEPVEGRLHQNLAALVCEETDNGRVAVRFLVDVMQGNLPDFKPHHRLAAAKELLRRGFDTPGAEDEAEAEDDENPRRHDPDGIYYRGIDGKWHRDERLSPPRPDRDAPVTREAEASSAPSPFPAEYNICKNEYGPTCFEICDSVDCPGLRHRGLVNAAVGDHTGCPPESLAPSASRSSPDQPPEVPPPERPPPPVPGSTASRISLDSIAVDSLNPNLFFSSETLPVPG
ncbi:MAG: hypothetical protein F4X65_14560 [Chloroflexi bacterium]|nr:hypothetical protein [Chloroflexota bacterium]